MRKYLFQEESTGFTVIQPNDSIRKLAQMYSYEVCSSILNTSIILTEMRFIDNMNFNFKRKMHVLKGFAHIYLKSRCGICCHPFVMENWRLAKGVLMVMGQYQFHISQNWVLKKVGYIL